MEFRMVKAMKPAPTSTTEQPGVMPRMTPCACSRVQKLWTPAPSAPATGARTADEPVAMSRSSYGSSAPSSSVRVLACVSTPTARRPMNGSTPRVRRRVGGAVKTCDSLMLPFR